MLLPQDWWRAVDCRLLIVFIVQFHRWRWEASGNPATGPGRARRNDRRHQPSPSCARSWFGAPCGPGEPNDAPFGDTTPRLRHVACGRAARICPASRVRSRYTPCGYGHGHHTFPGFYHLQPVVIRGEIRTLKRIRRLLGGRDAASADPEHLPTGAGSTTSWRSARHRTAEQTIHAFQVSTFISSAWTRRIAGRVRAKSSCYARRASNVRSDSRRRASDARSRSLRYVDEKVMVTGQFRGRNLYGDLLRRLRSRKARASPSSSADAALWVIGKQSKGRGWVMNPIRESIRGDWFR